MQRTLQLHRVVCHFGGMLDELDVPRCVREYVAHSGEADISDLTDRTTRAKVVRDAEAHGLLRTTRVHRLAHAPADGHAQRTVLYAPDVPPDTLHAFLAAVADGRAGWDLRGAARAAPALVDVPAHAPPPPPPWASAARVTLDAPDDPLLTPATRAAFARVSSVLRQYYGFPHGPAARLRAFHIALRATGRTRVDLAWFAAHAGLHTLATLVPVPLRSRALVRALRRGDVPVSELPADARAAVARTKGLDARLASYAAQLAALGAAHVEGNSVVLAECAPDGAPLATPADITAFFAGVRAARPALPRDVACMLAAPHAWQDAFALRRTQKLFLRRYTDAYAAASDKGALAARLAHASFATPAAVADFFCRAPARAPAQILSDKVAARRTQREAEADRALSAALAAAPPPPDARERTERALAALRRKYVWGREALAYADLERLAAGAVRAPHARRRRNVPAARPVRRTGARAAIPWTREHQELLRDAYVILHARQHAWAAAQAQPRTGAPDWTPVLQLIRADAALAPHASAAWNTWRSRLTQLARAPGEQVHLALLERAWTRVAAAARHAGTLHDPAFPAPGDVDLPAQIAFLRTHIDKHALVAQHAAASHAAVLPLRLTPAFRARWTPIAAPPAPRVSDAAPAVHRLTALRAAPASRTPPPQAAGPPPAGPRDGVIEAAVRMLANTPRAAVDAADVRAWIDALGAEAFDKAIARLVAARVVRVADHALVLTDEHVRAFTEPPLAGVMGDAAAAAAAAANADAVHAGPTATDGETAAWITLLARGAPAALDTAPLAALRQRTQLNSRSLDDVETECAVSIRGQAAAPDVVPPDGWVQVGHAQAAREGASDPDGVLIADAAPAAPGLLVGYDGPRLVAPAHRDAWTVPTAGGRLAPRLWRRLDGSIDEPTWRRAAALVVAWVLARPGVSLARLVAHVRPALDRAEVCDVVRAAAAAGVVRTTPTPAGLAPDALVHVDVGSAPWYIDTYKYT